MMSVCLHKSVLIFDTFEQQFFEKYRIILCVRATCLSYLTSIRPFLVYRKFISRLRLVDVADIKRNKIAQFLTISKEKFQRCFHQWKTRWNNDVECQGDYFEEKLTSHSLFIFVLRGAGINSNEEMFHIFRTRVSPPDTVFFIISRIT